MLARSFWIWRGYERMQEDNRGCKRRYEYTRGI
jgi:hypothetical protein